MSVISTLVDEIGLGDVLPQSLINQLDQVAEDISDDGSEPGPAPEGPDIQGIRDSAQRRVEIYENFESLFSQEDNEERIANSVIDPINGALESAGITDRYDGGPPPAEAAVDIAPLPDPVDALGQAVDVLKASVLTGANRILDCGAYTEVLDQCGLDPADATAADARSLNSELATQASKVVTSANEYLDSEDESTLDDLEQALNSEYEKTAPLPVLKNWTEITQSPYGQLAEVNDETLNYVKNIARANASAIVGIRAQLEEDINEVQDRETGDECPKCNIQDSVSDDFSVSVENISTENYPAIEVTTRVETEAGESGNLDASNFQICEGTANNANDDLCGQTLEGVVFAREDEDTMADVMVVIDVSGSMFGSKLNRAKDGAKGLVDVLNPETTDINIGLVKYNTSATLVSNLGTSENQIKNDIDQLSAGGGTDIGEGIKAAQNELSNSENTRSDAPNFIVVLANGDTRGGGAEATTAKQNGSTIFGLPYGSGANVQDFSSIAGTEPNDPDYQEFVSEANQTNITEQFEDIGQDISGTYGLVYETTHPTMDETTRNVNVYIEDPEQGDATVTSTYTSPSS